MSPVTPARRIVAYYTSHSDPLPLKGVVTDLDVGTFRIKDGAVIMNTTLPSDSANDEVWKNIAALQKAGIRTEAMLGGWGEGTFSALHNDFDNVYPKVRDLLKTYKFDGIDIDIEESFPLADTEQLIKKLRADFGSAFLITMSPVASDLAGNTSFSGGFKYADLEKELGSQISWYNAQFYCGWGTLDDTGGYDAIVDNGFDPSRVVAGTITNPKNCPDEHGYVQPDTLHTTLGKLAAKYPGFAGVAGWEYFNAVSANTNADDHASWYAAARKAVGA
ncbi:glycosyl hydrolase family 18 protein [Kitasatospora sp. NPDC098663]|uniref:glycosyl hydrolase family 18 protein n=1 Tax=Kitasatospora sp. NPDC098663 TaxID=3364096 RepID=UPI00380DE277